VCPYSSLFGSCLEFPPSPDPAPEPFFDGILNLLGKCRNVYDIVTVWDTEEVTTAFFILVSIQCSFCGFCVFYKLFVISTFIYTYRCWPAKRYKA
jgi:hypothetical protein